MCPGIAPCDVRIVIAELFFCLAAGQFSIFHDQKIVCHPVQILRDVGGEKDPHIQIQKIPEQIEKAAAEDRIKAVQRFIQEEKARMVGKDEGCLEFHGLALGQAAYLPGRIQLEMFQITEVISGRPVRIELPVQLSVFQKRFFQKEGAGLADIPKFLPIFYRSVFQRSSVDPGVSP